LNHNYNLITKYIVIQDGKKYKIEEGIADESAWRTKVKSLVAVVEDDKLNRLGDMFYDSRNHPYKSSLSKTWYIANPDLMPSISRNLSNYFTNITSSRADERLWTCFKEDVVKLKSNNVSPKAWLACNARATNDYADKKVLAYLINRYVDSFYEAFFNRKNIVIDNDEFALSEMMQWIWRSSIRNNKKINIYIPSLRMRTLLYRYLNNELIVF
jgi:hypothetical protein